MLNISIDLSSGIAKLSPTTVLKAGGAVPVKITFSSTPGTSPAIELALGPQSTEQAVVAFLDVFDAQSATVFTGTLDANDSRLVALLAGKLSQTLDCEIAVTTDAAGRRVFPNFSVAAQPQIITGPESSEGGPTYFTDAQSDARYATRADNLSDLDDTDEARENLNAAQRISGGTAGNLVSRDASGDIADAGVAVSTDGTFAANSDAKVPSEKAIKTYVAGLIDTTLKPPSDLDCSGNPDYPAGQAGDCYYVTVAGRIGGVAGKAVNVGDLISCKADAATGDEAAVGASWFVLESNRDQATEAVKGVAQLATTAQALAGTDDATIMTPAKTQAKLDAHDTAYKSRINLLLCGY